MASLMWLCLFSIFTLINCQHESNICVTPDNTLKEVCIPIKKCPQISAQLQKAETNAKKRSIFGKLKTCGFEGKLSLICCPLNMENRTTVPNDTVQNVNSKTLMPKSMNLQALPLAIDSHRNIHLLLEKCGETESDKLSFGNLTQLNEYSWMSLISYQTATGLRFLCGGTVISSRYILTAAHCITLLDKGISVAGVRIGEHDISTDLDCAGPDVSRYCADPVQDIAVEEMIAHPGFTKEALQHDIGLIRLARPIVFNGYVRRICLPITQQHLNAELEGKNGIVTGWGSTENGEPSSVLLFASLPIMKNEECGKSYTSKTIGIQQMCAGAKNGRSNSCIGDSGGPLQRLMRSGNTLRMFQYGIVSFGGRRCGSVGQPSVYTRVPYYMPWILDNMKD